MYIDEKLIKILEPHRGETIDVSYAISLIKTIAKEHETEQCDIHVVRSSSLFLYKNQPVEDGKKVTFIEGVRVDDWEQTITLILEKGTKVESLKMTMEKAQAIGLINFDALNYL